MSTRIFRAQALLAVAAGTFAPVTWAYLDPSTGSMIISAIVGLVASVALAVKTYWYRLVGLVRRLFSGGDQVGAMTEDEGECKAASADEDTARRQ